MKTLKTAVRRIKEPAKIVADITRPSDGARVFYVSSQSQPGKLYRVAVLRSRLACGCPASVYTGRCAHRTVVHEKLEAEYAELKSEREHTHDTVTISVSPDFGAKSAPRQSLVNRTAAFSLMK